MRRVRLSARIGRGATRGRSRGAARPRPHRRRVCGRERAPAAVLGSQARGLGGRRGNVEGGEAWPVRAVGPGCGPWRADGGRGERSLHVHLAGPAGPHVPVLGGCRAATGRVGGGRVGGTLGSEEIKRRHLDAAVGWRGRSDVAAGGGGAPKGKVHGGARASVGAGSRPRMAPECLGYDLLTHRNRPETAGGERDRHQAHASLQMRRRSLSWPRSPAGAHPPSLRHGPSEWSKRTPSRCHAARRFSLPMRVTFTRPGPPGILRPRDHYVDET